MDKRLLECGWAGLLTLDEGKYIKEKLEGSIRLRRKWKMGRRKHPPLTLIAQKAFPECPEVARRNIISKMGASNRSTSRTI